MFRSQVFYEYQENFRPALIELINGGVTERINAIQASVKMDLRRFPETRSNFMSDASLEENVEYLTDYLRAKIKIMDECYVDGTGSTVNDIELPLLERQASDFEINTDIDQEEEPMGIVSVVMQYKMLVMLLVMLIFYMILYYRYRKARK